MRHTYELTDETRKVISGNVLRTAEEMDVSDKYLHAILAGDKTDPFSPFVHLYAASVRAGNPVCYYDTRLAAIRARYEKLAPVQTEFECLSDKINTDADTTGKMVEALRDGAIDSVEAEKILLAVEKERKVLTLLETMLQFKVVPEVRKQMRGVVGGKR